MAEYIDVVFDAPPPDARFVEVENPRRKSIRFGQWIHREDGFWVLRIKESDVGKAC